MKENKLLIKIKEAGAIKFYRSQFEEMVLMDMAHGLMLVKQGLLSAASYHKIADGLNKTLREFKEDDVTGQNEDLYFNITAKLYEIVGEETGCLIHVGRSRNDMMCACNRMEVRKSIWYICDAMLDFMALLVEQAEKNPETIITYYTFGQPAQPGTLAHYYMMLFDLLARDFKRLQAAYENTNRSPMGAAAGIGTGFLLDRQYVCELLGFDSVIENTIDAISSSDYVLETESAVALMMTTISKAAQDLFFWASYENYILDCDLSICGGSSIMPQKKNPSAIELARSKSGRILGLLNEAFALSRNTSLFPNKEATVELHFMYWEYLDETIKAIRLMQTAIENSVINEQKSYSQTTDNFTAATTMAEELAIKFGLPFTETHHIVAKMIRRLVNDGTLAAKYLTGEMMREASQEVCGIPVILSDAEVQRMMDPLFCLQSKVTGGTPKPEDTRKLTAQNKALLATQKKWLAACKAKVEHAYAQIYAALC